MNIIHLISNKVWGGGERYVLDLARAQKADGHCVNVFSRRYHAVARPFIEDETHRGYLRLCGVFDIFTPIKLARYLRKLSGTTIIHVHNFKDAYTALAARRLTNRKDIFVVATRHLVRPAKTDKSHLSTISNLDAIIFASELAKKEFCSTLPTTFDCEHLYTVRNAIAIPPTLPLSKKSDESTPQLVYVGRLAAEKGVDILLEAMALIADRSWQLDIVGSGNPNYEVELEKQAHTLGIADRVHFKGYTDNVYTELTDADIAILPSRVPEACLLTIQEAYACAVAVVTTNNGAQPETVDDGTTGLLVNPESPRAIADAVTRLLDDRQLCSSMGQSGRLKLEQELSYKNFYEQIMAIYNGCAH